MPLPLPSSRSCRIRRLLPHLLDLDLCCLHCSWFQQKACPVSSLSFHLIQFQSLPSAVVGKLISQQSQISTVRLKFLLRAENRLLCMGHEVSITLMCAPACDVLWKSHSQGAKEPHVALEPPFAGY
uniref:Uncharacterized protein n=1 Tax=Pipistrellus kuhlii TaxID=59472 RepID=A0A7J7X042_PIPKU|nr:hypothetical protein mPipKuh1_010776 [Pipistrellus kuhlii]